MICNYICNSPIEDMDFSDWQDNLTFQLFSNLKRL